ncbi:MAG: peptidoglycan editing factor PgeF [Pseudomonadota bacterium]
MNLSEPMCITPEWDAPTNVKACCTTRLGGVSTQPFDCMNLSSNVGDDYNNVKENRDRISNYLGLPGEPFWLQQVHGCDIADTSGGEPNIRADASFSNKANNICTVLTADCLPVLFSHCTGKQVAIAHGGWRGIYAGIIEKTAERFRVPGSELSAWLGPGISRQHYVVGNALMSKFLDKFPESESAFTEKGDNLVYLDLYKLAEQRLQSAGVQKIFRTSHCTYSRDDLFFSYRRSHQTGRMASFIWFE